MTKLLDTTFDPINRLMFTFTATQLDRMVPLNSFNLFSALTFEITNAETGPLFLVIYRRCKNNIC